MYLPPHFKSTDRVLAARLMREHPLASLVSVDDDGSPFVSHLPLRLEDKLHSSAPDATHQADFSGSGFSLLGHCARANPHWRYLRQRPTALVTFLGPHAYLSPSIYPDLQRVPSWNYVAVHCKVQARLVEDPIAKDELLKKLIADHEPAYAAQWRSLGEEFAHKMLAGIVGFELVVTELECKIKLNQHRPEAQAALKAIYSRGNDNEQALVRWMNRLQERRE